MQPTIGGGSKLPEEGPSVEQPKKKETSEAGKPVSPSLISRMGANIKAKLSNIKEGFSKIGQNIEKKLTAKPKEERDPVKTILYSKTHAMQKPFQSKEVSKFQDDLAWDIEVGRGLMDEINKLEGEIAKTQKIISGENLILEPTIAVLDANQDVALSKAMIDLPELKEQLESKCAELKDHSEQIQKTINAFDEFQAGPQLFKMKQGVSAAMKRVADAEEKLSQAKATPNIAAAMKRVVETEKEVESSQSALTQKPGKPVSADSIMDEIEAEDLHGEAQHGLIEARKNLSMAQADSAKLPEVETARKELAKAKDDLEKARSNMEKLVKHRKPQESHNQIGMKLCEDLRGEAAHLQFQIEISLKPATEPEPEIIKSTESTVTEDMEKTKELGGKITACKTQIDEQSRAIIGLAKQLEETVSSNERLTTELSSVDQGGYKAVDLGNRLANNSAKKTELERQHAEASTKLEQLESEVGELMGSLAELFGEVAEHIEPFENMVKNKVIDANDQKTKDCKELCDNAWTLIKTTFREHNDAVERGEDIPPPPLPKSEPPLASDRITEAQPKDMKRSNQNLPEIKKQLLAIFSDITEIVKGYEFRTKVIEKQQDFYTKFYTNKNPLQKADVDAAIAFIDEQIRTEASKKNITFDLTKYEKAKEDLLKLFPS